MALIRKKLEKLRIRRSEVEIEPEEVLWDAFTQKKEERLFQKRLEVPLRPLMLRLLGLSFLILALAVLYQTLKMQTFEHQKYVALAQRNKFAVSKLDARRGVIYDSNFKQLVFNKPSYNLIFNKAEFPEDNKDQEKILRKVSWILGENKEILEKKIAQVKNDKTPVAQSLDYQKLLLLESNIEELKGFALEDVSVREYPEGPLLSHIIGYYRQSGKSEGLENFYNQFLSPKLGEVMTEKDVYGNVISKKVLSLPEPGKSLVLWIDSDLQKKLFDVMSQEMEKIGAKKGVAVALDPNTGGVLAMVSFPSFDNNVFSKGLSREEWERLLNDPNKPFLNRAVAGRYATGSTIKPLIAAAALQEGIVKEHSTINCTGKIVVDNPWYPDKPFVFRDWRAHGITDIKKAIAESCNVFFYTLGGGYKDFQGLGPEKIKRYLEFFGWGKLLGIDLPGEEQGFIPDKDWKKEKFKSPNNLWMPGDTYNLSIGQGFISITPLEVADAFASLVNGGKLLKPQIVKEIVGEDKKPVKEFGPEIIRQDFIDEKNLEIVKQGMRGTVTYGTAKSLNSLPVAVAGKTGTAQTSKKNRYHNWLTVFAPYENPKIVLTLMVENIPETYSVVLPTAYKVLNWYFGEETPK